MAARKFAILGLSVFGIATGVALWRQYEGNRERERELAHSVDCFALTHAGAAAERVLTSAQERGFDDLAKLEAYVADIEGARAEIAGTELQERALVEARDHLAQAMGDYGRVIASVAEAASAGDHEAMKAAADRIAPAAAALGPATAEVATVCDPPDA